MDRRSTSFQQPACRHSCVYFPRWSGTVALVVFAVVTVVDGVAGDSYQHQQNFFSNAV